MGSPRRGGFTLVELLVIMAIIALLVAILIPSMSRARHLGRVSVCASRLNGIGKAAHAYATENEGVLPTFVEKEGTSANKRLSDTVGFKAHNGSPSVATRSNTRGWYRTVGEGYVGVEMYACPSHRNVVAGTTEGLKTHDRYDFPIDRDLEPISYSLQRTKLWVDGGAVLGQPVTTLEPPKLVIAADATPLYRWSELQSDYSRVAKDADVAAGDLSQTNTPMHNSEGQNVLRLNLSVQYEYKPDCGIEGDVIWTNQGGGEPIEATPAVRRKAVIDSLLVP
jgi:type II secretory pathway pseudopilin PulG